MSCKKSLEPQPLQNPPKKTPLPYVHHAFYLFINNVPIHTLPYPKDSEGLCIHKMHPMIELFLKKIAVLRLNPFVDLLQAFFNISHELLDLRHGCRQCRHCRLGGFRRLRRQDPVYRALLKRSGLERSVFSRSS